MKSISHTHARDLIIYIIIQIRFYKVGLPTCVRLPGSLEDSFYKCRRDTQSMAHQPEQLLGYGKRAGRLSGGLGLVGDQTSGSILVPLPEVATGSLHRLLSLSA